MSSRNGSNNSEKYGARPKNPSPNPVLSLASESATDHDLSDFAESSPPVLQAYKDESRTVGGKLKEHVPKRFLTRSLRITPSETAPLLYSSPSEVQEESSNCCLTAIGCYKNSALKFRRSVFMHFYQLLVSAIPVSAIVMGIIFAESCPKVSFLPVFGAVVGATGAIFSAVWMTASCYNRRGTPLSNQQIFALGAAIFMILIVTIVDTVFVACLSPSFDPTSHEYCNETFYTYAFYKEIATAVAVIVSAVIYLPGSRHILCCYDCTMRSPASAFYYSI